MNDRVRAHVAFNPAALARDAILRRFERLSPEYLRFRKQLGLPTDRPVVMTGHQPGFWHPGILAKYHATLELADRLDADAASVVVDHDDTDPLALRLPASLADELPEPIDLHLAAPKLAGLIAARLPIVTDADARARIDAADIDPSVRTRLAPLPAALARHADAPNAAIQAALANADLLDLRSVSHFSVTDIAHTDLFAELVQRLIDEPAAHAAYNRAIAKTPNANVPPLAGDAGDDRAELPLWRLRDDGKRLAATRADAAELPPAQLRPRALTMTGLLRLAACDAFIHGTGGAQYDRVTEPWFNNWLEEPIAPIIVATADAYLPNEPTEPVSSTDVRDALWRAHHARHSPATLSDDDDEHERRTLVRAIKTAPPDRRDARFRELHAFLHDYRERRRDQLADLQHAADRARRIHDWQRRNAGRLWPAIIHPDDTLAELRRAVAHACDAAFRNVPVG